MSWRYVQLIFYTPAFTPYTLQSGTQTIVKKSQNTCVYQRKSVPLQRKSGQNNLFFSEKAGKMPFNSSEKADNINRTV